MPESIVVRPERPDHPQVVALIASLDDYLATLYPPEANHLLDVNALLAPEVSFLAAFEGERVVGCGAVRQMPGEAATDGRAYGEIKRMFVDPSMRGRGVARALLDELEQAALQRGLTQTMLETGEDQVEAVRLYQRCGYRRRPAFGGYPDNGLSLFFAKVLA